MISCPSPDGTSVAVGYIVLISDSSASNDDSSIDLSD